MRRTVEELRLTPEALAELRLRYQPVGSGPLGVMRTVVRLVEAIAADKGWDLDGVEFIRECWNGKDELVSRTRYKGMQQIEELPVPEWNVQAKGMRR